MSLLRTLEMVRSFGFDTDKVTTAGMIEETRFRRAVVCTVALARFTPL